MRVRDGKIEGEAGHDVPHLSSAYERGYPWWRVDLADQDTGASSGLAFVRTPETPQLGKEH